MICASSRTVPPLFLVQVELLQIPRQGIEVLIKISSPCHRSRKILSTAKSSVVVCLWESFTSGILNLICFLEQMKVLSYFVCHWIDKPRHNHTIFGLSYPISWTVHGRWISGSCDVVILSFPIHKHHIWPFNLSAIWTSRNSPCCCSLLEHLCGIHDYRLCSLEMAGHTIFCHVNWF